MDTYICVCIISYFIVYYILFYCVYINKTPFSRDKICREFNDIFKHEYAKSMLYYQLITIINSTTKLILDKTLHALFMAIRFTTKKYM